MLTVAIALVLATEPATETATEPATEPATVEAPLDTEVPEPSGRGLQLREYRRIEALTGLDLEDAWESYEENYRYGEREPFIAHVRRRFRVRRGIGIALVVWGAAVFGASFYFWAETGRTEIYEGQGVSAFAAVAMTTAGVTGVAVGGFVWARWQGRLRSLDGLGALVRAPGRPRAGLAPLALPRGAGLGLRLAF